MDSSTVLWIVGVLVVVAVLAALVVVAGRRRDQGRHRERAQELRAEATTHLDEARESRVAAAEAEARAERARLEAERAQAEADAVRQEHLVEEARVEDRVREADRVDPDVDHRDDGYRPEMPRTGPEVPGQAASSEEPVRGADRR